MAKARTTWHVLGDGPGLDLVVLQEWHTADLDSLVDAARASAVSERSASEAFQWAVPDGGAVLMFAGDAVGNSGYTPVPVPLQAGLHSVAVASVDLDLGAVFVCRIRRR